MTNVFAPADRTPTPGVKSTPAVLRLDDGTIFEGVSIGYNGGAKGCVVFNTAMVGFPEALTNPEQKGLIVVTTWASWVTFTVKTPEKDSLGLCAGFESEHVAAEAVIIPVVTIDPDDEQAPEGHLTVLQWFKENKLPAITGLNTRALVKHIAKHGEMRGEVFVGQTAKQIEKMPLPPSPRLRVERKRPPSPLGRLCHARPEYALAADEDLVAPTSTSDTKVFMPEGDPSVHVGMIDLGVNAGLIRYFVRLAGAKVTLLTANEKPDMGLYDCVVVSTGPGNPAQHPKMIEWIKEHVSDLTSKPLLGLGLGCQIMALAIGCTVQRLHLGQRGTNQPVLDLRTHNCMTTTQNYGYAVDSSSLPKNWATLFTHVNRGTCEGIVHESRPFMGLLFRVERGGQPCDTSPLVHNFVQAVKATTMFPMAVSRYHLPANLRKVLVVGPGGQRIGTAQFDYCCSSAVRAVVDSGCVAVVVNPNSASVSAMRQGLPQGAIVVYNEPVRPDVLLQVIRTERPEGALVSFGGDLALSAALGLAKSNQKVMTPLFMRGEPQHMKMGDDLKDELLQDVKILGTDTESVRRAESKWGFRAEVAELLGLRKVFEKVTSKAEADGAAGAFGFPLLVTVEQKHGGQVDVVADQGQLDAALSGWVSGGCKEEAYVEVCMGDWKRIEYEILRDNMDNCLSVVDLESLDPMGVHSQDSIMVIPSQTMTNEEMRTLRNVSFTIARHFNVVGAINLQYAFHPKTREFQVISSSGGNLRTSRTSTVAAKASGYPIAYVAARLAMGSNLVELRNLMAEATTACCEPSMDYVAVRAPVWPSDQATHGRQLNMSQQSVGEVLAFGRTFEESLQKALRMASPTRRGFESCSIAETLKTEEELLAALKTPTPERIRVIAEALKRDMAVDKIHDATGIDPWFLAKMRAVVSVQLKLTGMGLEDLDARPDLILLAKRCGFSDDQLARVMEGTCTELEIRDMRWEHGIRPGVTQVDVLAGAVEPERDILYLSYNTTSDVSPLDPASQAIVVLGAGAGRVGEGSEQDFATVCCTRTLRASERHVILLNNNPQATSTDMQESDRLYFDELSVEAVLEIDSFEKPKGVLALFGGYCAAALCWQVAELGSRISFLGTPPESLQLTLDRVRFHNLCEELTVPTARAMWAGSSAQPQVESTEVKGPVLRKPRWGMAGDQFHMAAGYAELKAEQKEESLVVECLCGENARQVVLDGVAQRGEILTKSLSEVIECAPVHCGDSVMLCPPQYIAIATYAASLRCAQKLVKALSVDGPFSISLVYDASNPESVFVVGCNLYTSRYLPMTCHTYLGEPWLEEAAKVVMGVPRRSKYMRIIDVEHVACRIPVFSFGNRPLTDPRLGSTMQATGEVVCFGAHLHEAYIRALQATGTKLPDKGILVSLGGVENKLKFAPLASLLIQSGFTLYVTEGTRAALIAEGVGEDGLRQVYPLLVATEPNCATLIDDGTIEFVINIPSGDATNKDTSGFQLRRKAVDRGIGLINSFPNAKLFTNALRWYKQVQTGGLSWGEGAANPFLTMGSAQVM